MSPPGRPKGEYRSAPHAGSTAPPPGRPKGEYRSAPQQPGAPKSWRAWLLLCALHGAASMLLWWACEDARAALTWRAADWLHQPWTLWSSTWVHVNTRHLIGNLLGLGALAVCAWIVRPPLPCTLAWLLAWPLSQASLLLWPQIGYAVGLSGLLHAGAMVLAVHLMLGRIPLPKARRWGALLALGLLLKLALERGLSNPLVWDAGSDMWVVQAVHLSGACWGLLLGMLCITRAARGGAFAG